MVLNIFYAYSRLSFMRLIQVRKMMTDKTDKDEISSQIDPKPYPLRKIPLKVVRKYRAGTKAEIHWMTLGMLLMGKMKPERR
jgi:hypothetical protein